MFYLNLTLFDRGDYTSGIIKVNGRTRDLKLFRSQSAYIMQDDLLQTHITVWEAMYFSVNLKIGSQLKQSEKKERVCKIQLRFINHDLFNSHSQYFTVPTFNELNI